MQKQSFCTGTKHLFVEIHDEGNALNGIAYCIILGCDTLEELNGRGWNTSSLYCEVGHKGNKSYYRSLALIAVGGGVYSNEYEGIKLFRLR